MSDLKRDDPAVRLFLRHSLATLAYRAGKTVRGTPAEFGAYRPEAPNSRSVVEILAHMGDLMDWVLSQVKGKQAWRNSDALPWDEEIARFFAAVKTLDDYLASGAPIEWDPGESFQGGIADALTHTGQLAMLRHQSGFKMKGESYAKADIEVGRVGLEQTPANPKFEFD